MFPHHPCIKLHSHPSIINFCCDGCDDWVYTFYIENFH
nr:MAG TPA: hypothetical protein [Caudoviricetes sp.]